MKQYYTILSFFLSFFFSWSCTIRYQLDQLCKSSSWWKLFIVYNNLHGWRMAWDFCLWTNRFFLWLLDWIQGFSPFALLYGPSATILTTSLGHFGSAPAVCQQYFESYTPPSNSLFSIQNKFHYSLVILIETGFNRLELNQRQFIIFCLFSESSHDFNLLFRAVAALPRRWSVGCLALCTWIFSLAQITYSFGLLCMW